MLSSDRKPKSSSFAQRLVANKANVLLWTSFFVIVLLVYHQLSDGDFSFLLTLGGMARAFALTVLVVKILVQKSAHGVSAKSLQIYVLVFFFRLCSILVYEGYLPYDRSGDWVYQAVEILAMVLVSVSLFFVLVQYRATYTVHQDTFGKFKGVPSALGVVWLVVPCLLLALFIHPSLNGNYFTDASWTFACYLETIAMVPQLYMFAQRKGSDSVVENFTSHYVFTLGGARFLHFLFWLSSYHELNDKYSGIKGYVGYFVLGSQFLQMIIMMNYSYHYLKSAATGAPMDLPTHIASNV